MKTIRIVLAHALALFCTSEITFAVERFVSPVGAHQSPFTNWTDAATNIQDAVDVANAGDVVWVTNGVYSSGGKIMSGDLLNRVALDKALTVQSVNGPEATIIQGFWDTNTNGPLAVRCSWLTNGATLKGFTLENGATRMTGDGLALRSGGGIWCASTNSIVENCIIKSNAANVLGAAVYQGNLNNCFITQNKSGPGVVYNALLNHCTVVSNLAVGVSQCKLTNCIVYFNAQGNYLQSTFSYTCTTPLYPSGIGNVASDPQLLHDNLHFSTTSPCRSSGTNTDSGTDMFGQPWGNPPSMGCLEWPVTPFSAEKPQFRFSSPAGFSATMGFVGQGPFTFYWMHNGVPVENDERYNITEAGALIVKNLSLSDAGNYQAIASNSFGSVTSPVAQLVIHTVDAAGTGTVAPYLDWATAATNIQDAIDAAAAGEFVLVTNGVYQTGGKSMDGVLTNRVAIDKALFVIGINGAEVTTIRGNLDPATNGVSAMRCVWMTNNAVLSGFTLRDGATRVSGGSINEYSSGGGVWGTSTNALIFNSVIATNFAFYGGGGAYRVAMSNCVLVGNYARGSGTPGAGLAGSGSGGGAAGAVLQNCVIRGNSANNNGGGTVGCQLISCVLTENSAYLYGGAAYTGWLLNCTVVGNTSGGYGLYGGAVANTYFTNSIVVSNLVRGPVPTNYYNSTSVFSCTFPLPPGAGNIAVDPQLLPDGFHLSETSPCRAAGTNGFVASGDIDGQLFANPPSMGSDEWYPEPVLGGGPEFQVSGNPASLKLSGAKAVGGQGPFTLFWLKNGVPLGESSRYSTEGLNLSVNNFGLTDSGAYELVASNAFGIVTSGVVRVRIHGVVATGSSPVAPYSTWETAAADIQDAIDVAEAGAIILVTNGLYSNGGKVMAGDLTNRIAITKPMTVLSVNGPASTIIQGAWDANTNGPSAVRCAWLADGAMLRGFTLQNGATRTSGGPDLQNGGSVFGVSTQASVFNCFIYTNAASADGGGSYGVSLECCRVIGNSSLNGGGIAMSAARNSLVAGNAAVINGGGVYGGVIRNCTVVGNSAMKGAGVYAVYNPPVNSIIYGNDWESAFPNDFYGTSVFPINCCIFGYPTNFPYNGSGNIDADPQFTDGFHLATTSPCRGTGNSLDAFGADLDAEPWLNPPSMGCDEVIESAINGPLSVHINEQWDEIVENRLLYLFSTVTGRVTRTTWSFGDGSVLTNATSMTAVHSWTNAGDYTVTFTAYNSDNTNGVSASTIAHVVPLITPEFSSFTRSGTNFTLGFVPQPSVTYYIERATNLAPPVSWQTVGAVYGASNYVELVDTKATNAVQFYRVRIR